MNEMNRRHMLHRMGAAISGGLATSLLAGVSKAQAPPAASGDNSPAFRLGIVGSDNSHSAAFAQLANRPEGRKGVGVEGVRVTHIYGTDPELTAKRAQSGQIPNIVQKKEDMIGEVDGVAVVWRHGRKHLEETLPFLEAGVPVFVDKPLASSVEDAKKLIMAAQKADVGFTSFSTLRWADSTRQFISSLKDDVGEPISGISSGHADLESEYDGLVFYGIHTVELINAVWGCGCRSIQATEHNRNVLASCKFESGAIVTASFLVPAKWHHLVVYGDKGFKELDIDDPTAYRNGMQLFVETMRAGTWPLAPDELLEPVKMLAAVERSLKENREVSLDEV